MLFPTKYTWLNLLSDISTTPCGTLRVVDLHTSLTHAIKCARGDMFMYCMVMLTLANNSVYADLAKQQAKFGITEIVYYIGAIWFQCLLCWQRHLVVHSWVTMNTFLWHFEDDGHFVRLCVNHNMCHSMFTTGVWSTEIKSRVSRCA